MIKAVIFDFDGVIVDTEPLHYRAFQEVLHPEQMTFTWEEYMAEYIGYDDRDAFRAAFKQHNRELGSEDMKKLVEKKAKVFCRLVADEDLQPYPGVRELVSSLKGQLPLAICSGALRSDIEPILKRFNMTKSFNLMVTADEVGASKPDPESYQKALADLAVAFPGTGIEKESAVAIEDTPAGIASARGAGLAVLGVSNSYPAEALNEATATVESLVGVTQGTLEKLLKT